MTTIKVTAQELSDAYLNGKASGCVRAPEGLTSEGREVRFITIAKGSHNVTLSGLIRGSKWEQTYKYNKVVLDD